MVPWTSSLRPITREGSPGQQTYLKECSGCHGDNLAGVSGFPSLMNLAARRTPQQVAEIVREGAGRMPGFSSLPAETQAAVVQYVLSGEGNAISTAAPSPTELPYSFTGYHKWLDPDGYPAVAPPWGTLNAIDLNTGEYRWKISREYPALAAQGIKDPVGTLRGPIVTAGGLLFSPRQFRQKFSLVRQGHSNSSWKPQCQRRHHDTLTTNWWPANVVIAAFGGSKTTRRSGERRGQAPHPLMWVNARQLRRLTLACLVRGSERQSRRFLRSSQFGLSKRYNAKAALVSLSQSFRPIARERRNTMTS